MYRKIVLACDDSDSSAAVLGQGADLAGLCRADVHVLSIVATSGSMAIAEAVGAGDVWGQGQEEIQRRTAIIAEALRRSGLTVETCVRLGDPGAEIVAYAHEVAADLVVVGHAGKSALARLLEGSVSGRLLHHLPCSLLVAVDQPSKDDACR